MRRKLGKIYVDDATIGEAYDNLRLIMAQLVVVSAFHDYANCKFEYVAISHHFSDVDCGQLIPEYIVSFDELLGVTFNKV